MITALAGIGSPTYPTATSGKELASTYVVLSDEAPELKDSTG